MSRQMKNGKCSCWKTIDKKLSEHNTRLSQSFTFTGHLYLNVGTENIEKSRKSPKTVIASYCPFCGEKLKEPSSS